MTKRKTTAKRKTVTKSKEEETIGQRVAAAVISRQLGMSMKRARLLYIAGKEIAPEWEQVGAALLGSLGPLLSAAPIDPESRPS